MNDRLAGTLLFLSGIVLGVAGTRLYFKTKYEKMFDEEVEAYKKYKEKKHADDFFVYGHEDDEVDPEEFEGWRDHEEEDDIPEDPKSKPITAYHKITKNYGGNLDIMTHTAEEKVMAKPYVISPEDFDPMGDRETFSLTYYADGVLVDDDGDLVDDIDNTIGEESLNHFGEYEEDSVFVRNDRLNCDYEILKDYRNYSDVEVRDLHPEED